MAEGNNGKQHISLNICDERIDIYVKADEEGYYREAEKLVRSTYGKYADMFRGRRSERFIAATALLEIGVKYQMEHASKDTDSYNNLLERLTADIDKALGK
jgi:cell division protein ZapA